MHCNVKAVEAGLLVGSEWSLGVTPWTWKVVAADGERVKVVRADRATGQVIDPDPTFHAGGFWWHYSSLTKTTAKRVFRA